MLYSIIVPVYNVEQWLPECLSSIEAQTCKDWQVVLIDDGSTDGSSEICDAFATRWPGRVIVVHQDNNGLLAARRAGLRVATGDIVIAVDSDDMLRKDALEKIDSVFRSYDVDLVIYGSTRDADYSTINTNEPFGKSRYFSYEDKLLIVRKLCASHALNSMWSKAVRREFVDIDADYSSYGRLNYAEDLLQSLPIIDSFRTAYYIHEPLYYYRVNYKSLTKCFNPSHLEARDAVRTVQLAYAEKWAAEFGDAGLVNDVRSLGLKDYAEVAQSASEGLPLGETIDYLRNLVSRKDYLAICSSGYEKSLRGDFALIASLLKSRHFSMLWLFCRLKGVLCRLVGK